VELVSNPDKIRVIIQMQPPLNRKDVQKLTARIASLNRFISKLAEQSHTQKLHKSKMGSRATKSL
jgi:polyhydroxyalkanoate synthesis regulator phasin